MLVLYVFSLSLCRDRWCGSSVTGHRTSLWVLAFWPALHDCASPVMGVYAVVVPHSALAVLSPCGRREKQAGKVSKAQTSEPIWRRDHMSCFVFFSLEIQLKFFLISSGKFSYCEVNNDFYVPQFRNMFNKLFKPQYEIKMRNNWHAVWKQVSKSSYFSSYWGKIHDMK